MSSSSSMIGSSRGALQLFHSQPQELIERKYQLIREHKNEIRSTT